MSSHRAARAPSGVGALLTAAVLAVVLGVLAWQARADTARRPTVDAPSSTTWTPRPTPARPVEPRPGAWCADRCRNGKAL